MTACHGRGVLRGEGTASYVRRDINLDNDETRTGA